MENKLRDALERVQRDGNLADVLQFESDRTGEWQFSFQIKTT